MKFVPAQINIGSMNITNTDHSSTISFGSALEVGRNVGAKKTQGIGQQFADRILRISTVSMVLDDDMVDNHSKKINK
ncbi:hypothetical protein LJK88_01620 [Paenibacillus sp. P26]|nr:hypothetical protein LJK88_01620 [Paenibacillus sp. P26]